LIGFRIGEEVAVNVKCHLNRTVPHEALYLLWIMAILDPQGGAGMPKRVHPVPSAITVLGSPVASRTGWPALSKTGRASASFARIENYLGFPDGISGQALTGRAYVQAQKLGQGGDTCDPSISSIPYGAISFADILTSVNAARVSSRYRFLNT
jgi:hypothetical protein